MIKDDYAYRFSHADVRQEWHGLEIYCLSPARSKKVFRQILCSGALRLALRTTSTVHLIRIRQRYDYGVDCTIVGYFQEVKGSRCSWTRWAAYYGNQTDVALCHIGSMNVSAPTMLVSQGGNCHSYWFARLCMAVCFIHGASLYTRPPFRFRYKWTAKKKNHLKTRKSTSWHSHKRKGHCIISLNIVV